MHNLWNTSFIGLFITVLMMSSATEAKAINTDIKANGSDSTLTIGTSDTLSVTVSLDPEGNTQSADWWLVMVKSSSPTSWNHWGGPGIWNPGLNVSYQGNLTNLSNQAVYNVSGLAADTYTFYFGIDTNADGSLSMSELTFDSVVVNVTAPAPAPTPTPMPTPNKDKCSNIAGHWSGTYSDRYCDGGNYYGNWTANVSATCSITAYSEGIWFQGKVINNTLNVSAYDPECGEISVVSKFTEGGTSGSYTYQYGGSGTFSGSKQ